MTATTDRRPRPLGWRFALAALAAAVIAFVLLITIPAGTRVAETSTRGITTEVVERTTLLAENAPHVLTVLAIPILLTVLGLVPERGARITSALLLWMFSALALFSVGIFFVPAAGLMTASAVATPRVEGAR